MIAISSRSISSKSVALCGAAVVAILGVVCTGCGSSSMSHTMSQAQAQAVSHEFATAMASALQSAASGVPAAAERHNLGAAVSELQPAQSSDCTTTMSGTTCNIPVSSSASCPGGGTIGVTGSLDFSLDTSGDGSDTASFTITPSNCSVDNLTVNGNPNVMVGTQLNFQKSMIAFPVTFMENGGITFGPNPSGSCSINVTGTANSLTSCTVTGTVCGQSVSGNC